jgi:hypothetical protein
MYRKTSLAGKRCERRVSGMDPQARYCCAHYKQRKVQQSPLSLDSAAHVQSLQAQLQQLSVSLQAANKALAVLQVTTEQLKK